MELIIFANDMKRSSLWLAAAALLAACHDTATPKAGQATVQQRATAAGARAESVRAFVPDAVAADWLTYQGDGFTIRYPKEATLVRAESHPSSIPGMAIQGPRIHVPVPPNVGPSDGPAYRLIVSSLPNPHGWSAEQWVDSLRRETNRDVDADSLGYLAAPDTVVLGSVRALRLQPFCGDCEPYELYVATPRRMIVVSYIFDISVPGDREAQRRLYRAIASTLRAGDCAARCPTHSSPAQ